MEGIIIHESDNITFEPLTSYADLKDLFIGDSTIFMESLTNLYHSGIKKVYFLVESYKANKYKGLEKSYNIGKRDSQLLIEVVGVNVVKMEVGPVLREFFTTHTNIQHFILMYSNTLVSVPISDALEFHENLMKTNSKYTMTMLYTHHNSKLYNDMENDGVVVMNEKTRELLMISQGNLMSFDHNLFSRTAFNPLSVRYDLLESSVYLCSALIIESVMEHFDKNRMSQLVNSILTDEIRTSEIYCYILQNDAAFPNFPAALKINSPRLYHAIYLQYIQRFLMTECSCYTSGNSSNVRSKRGMDDMNKGVGPRINESSYFNKENTMASSNMADKSVSNNVKKSILGENVKIGDNSTIVNSIIFDNVVVHNNCTIIDTIVMDNCVINEGVNLVSGSLVGKNCEINQKLANRVKSLFCAKDQTKFYDLTDDFDEVDGNVFLWNLEPFITDSLYKIGDELFNHISFSIELDNINDSSTQLTELTDLDDLDELEDLDEDLDSNIHGLEDSGINLELEMMIIESLEEPQLVENKLLEIRSLRLAHNITETDMKIKVHKFAIKWLIQNTQEDNIVEVIEKSQFEQLLKTFKSKSDNNLNNVEDDLFEEIFRLCVENGRDELYFCKLMEGFYHTEVIDLEEFPNWTKTKQFKEPRLISFSKWLEED
ncbi:translation initiation factor eif-2b epsilon subunit, putative [Theileria annulata]|uniref:Translation initiation factor eIF2B subunit epsilon n=1 Tax=Theileria annulata TaxID=5874 RepID=Q4UGC0_THEAN|nr:translation initiation factor eif-2b epsilon subunit, putative [Theileria annulata]CAI73869.1 translation initiation factor eif-2b epsilon subunit, putative [Theileria annulata]|eukprot:XP_954546.1 translation initiation factor eif-2b epsilon subunit, putative [Theileria annulata]